MADTKASALSVVTPAATGRVYGVVDPTGTPASNTFSNTDLNPNIEITAEETADGITSVDIAFAAGNVKRHGAIGDDSNDDTAAIQAAFDAVVTTGDAVIFPAGVYKITAAVTTGPIDNKKTNVIGYGATIKQYTSSKNILNIRNSRCYVYGLKFEHDSGVAASNGVAAIDVLDVNDVSISDCVFNDCKTKGIFVRTTAVADCTDVVIKGCHFNECDGTNITLNSEDVSTFVRRVSIVGNTFNASNTPVSDQTRAIHVVSNVTDVTIANNVTSGTGHLTYVTGWRDCVQIGNSSATLQPDNVTITGNVLTGMGDESIGMSGATNITISNNVLHGSLVTSGVYVPGDGTWSNNYVTVTGNMIYDHKLAGIFLKDTLTYAISGNVISDCKDGIFVNDNGVTVLRGTISGNTIENVERRGIHWDGGACVVTGNIIDGYGDAAGAESEKAAIFIDVSGSDSIVSNNSMKNGIHGILVTAAPDTLALTGNLVASECTGSGIRFLSYTGDNLLVANNILLSTTTWTNEPTASPTKVFSGNLPPPNPFTITNLSTDRTYDADTVVVAELADVVGTLISDMGMD